MKFFRDYYDYIFKDLFFFLFLHLKVCLSIETLILIFFSLYLNRESNPNLKFRELLFYPLNYRGISTEHLILRTIFELENSICGPAGIQTQINSLRRRRDYSVILQDRKNFSTLPVQIVGMSKPLTSDSSCTISSHTHLLSIQRQDKGQIRAKPSLNRVCTYRHGFTCISGYHGMV